MGSKEFGKDGSSSVYLGDTHAIDMNRDEPVTITFESVTYSVSVPVKKLSLADRVKGLSLSGFPRTERLDKILLKDVTGTIRPNTMTALMGPSGAGKSTLLDVLAKRKNSGALDGEILVNGKEPDIAFKRLIGYVEQKDVLLATLTPRQLFYYTARIRLPSSTTEAFINDRVIKVIEELGLQTCQDTVIGNAVIRGISGGQAKRVNIGVELITDPRVLFLDEPTTGLDSSTALEVMMVMRDLTNRGRTTIATIHQPSTDTYNLFDKLLLLVDGNIVYLGDASKAVSYYEDLGFIYPADMNPADYLIAVVGGGTGHGEKMVEGPDVNKNFFIEQYAESELMQQRMKSAAMLSRRKTVQLEELPKPPVQFVNNAFHNFKYILIRTYVSVYKDPKFWFARFFRIFFIVFLFATLFANQKKTEAGVYNTFSVFNAGTMVFGFGALGYVPGLINKRIYFQRERSSSAYQVSAFYMAEIMCELPLFMMQCFIWTLVMYPSVGLRMDVVAVICYYFALLFAAEIGYACSMFSSYFAADMEGAGAVGLPILMLSFMFSGFYIQAPQIAVYWKWAYYTSYLAYILSIFSINQWPPGQNDGYTRCEGTVCMPWDNNDILAFWGTGSKGVSDKLWVNWIIALSIWLFWRVCAYLALRFREHGKR